MIGDACIKNDGPFPARIQYIVMKRGGSYIAAEAKTGFTPTVRVADHNMSDIYLENRITVPISFTGIRPVIAFIQRVALSAWATTAQCNAHAIRTQTVHPPVSCANRRAIRPTTLDARVLQRDPLHPRRPCRAERLRAQSRRHSAMLERRLDRVTPGRRKELCYIH
ncbi:hypothetical protein EVAR_83631_1 [Eumeta japonica]|uniref:Uncharacterized protein n=1 Tax=Eumeta variegata TaxID=151549 RepID=A0A4C1UP51_EUMVA|nr:hypothetical protein EVAR_83631_1 [Eumeta japonica]